jgi:hypothetical protein
MDLENRDHIKGRIMRAWRSIHPKPSGLTDPFADRRGGGLTGAGRA